MAKKTTKKAAKKSASKKTTSKKAPSKKAAKKVASKKDETPAPKSNPSKGSPIDQADKKLTAKALTEIGQSMIDKKGRAPFSVATDLKEAAKRARELNAERNTGEAELSATLYYLNEQSAHANEAHEKIEDYCDQVLDISRNKARTLIATWEVYHKVLGLPNHLLREIDYAKFKEVVGAVKAGHMNKAAVTRFLPLMVKSGATRTTVATLRQQVKEFVAKRTDRDGAEGNDVKMRRLGIQLPEEDMEGFLDVLTSYKEAIGVEADGVALQRCLDFTASAHINEAGAAAVGLLNLTNIIARTNNVTPVIIANDDSETFDNLGVHPVTKLYGHFNTRAGDSDDWGKFCMAANKEDAAQHLGVKIEQVREFDFTISDLLKPEATYGGPVRALTDETEEDEPGTSETSLSEETAADDGGEDSGEQEEEVERDFEFSADLVDRYMVATIKDEEVDVIVVDVNMEKELISVKRVDDDWEPKGRKSVLDFKDIVSLYPPDEEEEDETEEDEGDDETFDLGGDDGTTEEAADAKPAIPTFEPDDIEGMTADVMRIGKMVAREKDAATAKEISKKNTQLMNEARKKAKKGKDPRTIALPLLLAFAYEFAQGLGLDPFEKASA